MTTISELKEPIEGIVGRGRDALLRWEQARQSLERLERDLTSVRCELANATNELGKFLMPSDAEPGERVGIWIRDRNQNEIFISATRTGPHDFIVTAVPRK